MHSSGNKSSASRCWSRWTIRLGTLNQDASTTMWNYASTSATPYLFCNACYLVHSLFVSILQRLWSSTFIVCALIARLENECFADDLRDEAEDRDHEYLNSAALQSMIAKKERDIALLRKLRGTKAQLCACNVAAGEQDPVYPASQISGLTSDFAREQDPVHSASQMSGPTSDIAGPSNRAKASSVLAITKEMQLLLTLEVRLPTSE